jgi:HAD superfamily hydrolase (TIGR01509 family)
VEAALKPDVNRPGPIRAIIFDFDGLILDTEVPIFTSWQELYNSFGGHLSLIDWQHIVGTVSNEEDHFDDLEAQIGRTLDKTDLRPRRRQREYELIDLQAVRPGIAQYLCDARRLGLKIGLASSSPCAWVTGHLARLGLIDYFDCIRARDDVSEVKPDPELYLTVLRDLEIQPHEAIVLEDSPIGVSAARNAGLFCVAVPNPVTAVMPLDHASMRLDSLADLPLEDLIQRATSGNGKPMPGSR